MLWRKGGREYGPKTPLSWEAENTLLAFAGRWREKYPSCVKSQQDNWEVIKGLNRQFRQITKSKPSFTNDDSLHRMSYLASQRIMKHWYARCQNWDLVLSQLELMFP